MKDQNLTIPKLVKTFEVGSRVVISPRMKFSGMPHPRYRGRSGIITGTRGNAYEVEILDGRMKKELIIPPVHLIEADKTG